MAAALFVLVVWGVCTVYVRPNEFAVKQVTVGRHKGILPEVYYPGLHFVSPGTERLHVFPTDIQSLDLTNDPNERPKDDKRVTPAINIQTSEGYTVTVDVSVLYRIEDPYKVLTTIGPGKLYEDALVIPRTEQMLRKRLGELDAEEFYDVNKRMPSAPAASREELNAELVPNGIRVTHIFLRRYVYDARYQAAIEQRKIQDQTVFKNIAEAELCVATAERDRVVALGQAAVRVELSRGRRGEEEARRRGGPLLPPAARRGRAGGVAGRGRGHAPGERGAPRRRGREPGRPEDGGGPPGDEGHRGAHRRRVRASTRSTSARRSSAST